MDRPAVSENRVEFSFVKGGAVPGPDAAVSGISRRCIPADMFMAPGAPA